MQIQTVITNGIHAGTYKVWYFSATPEPKMLPKMMVSDSVTVISDKPGSEKENQGSVLVINPFRPICLMRVTTSMPISIPSGASALATAPKDGFSAFGSFGYSLLRPMPWLAANTEINRPMAPATSDGNSSFTCAKMT